MLPGRGGDSRRWLAPVVLLAGLALPWSPTPWNPGHRGADNGLLPGEESPLAALFPGVFGDDPASESAFTPDPVAAPRGSSRDPSVAALEDELIRLLRTGSRTERWGVLVTSLESGDTLFALNPEEPLAPASNQKLFTSAAALHLLGPDFRFATYLLTDGVVRDGVLHGNLRLYGTGDPTVGGANPARPTGASLWFLETLQALGIREIRGDVIGDGTFFSGDPRRPSWNPNDLDHWYAAPISGLNYQENMVSLRVEPPRFAGAPATIHTIPEGARLPIRNETGPLASIGGPSIRSGLAVVRDDPDGAIRVVGQLLPRDREVWRALTVSDPPQYAASVFVRTLELGGITVRGGAASDQSAPAAGRGGGVTGRTRFAPAISAAERETEWQTLAVHHSPPVSELIHTVNKRSHNLFSEALLLAMGRVGSGDGSFEGGQAVLLRFLVDSVGIPESHLHIEDGSGLSRLNRTSPLGLVRLLAWMEASPFRDPFLQSLPVAGNRRELGRMGGTPAAGNLWAKTGTIHQTSALSGIVRSGDGERLAFSIVVNGVPSTSRAKRVEDLVGSRLAGFARTAPP
jgi:serine-type D-Ala-D-Ala carboxypeptidase/endopeptidase (penicillin-binding protein 4)